MQRYDRLGLGFLNKISVTLILLMLNELNLKCPNELCVSWAFRHVAGLNAGRARSIMEWREKNGPFLNREQLKLVKGLGPKSFQQCAGFIRVNPETVHRYSNLYLLQAAFILCAVLFDSALM